jgi:nitroreductase
MNVDDALRTTRAVRKRLDLDRPVPRAVVNECLELALQAPNGSNFQLWRWIIVDDAATRAAMATIYRDALDSYAAGGADASMYDHEHPDQQRISASVMYLRDNVDRVPVLALPLLAARVEGLPVFYQASLWGSVLPSVWSFMLALRDRGLGSAWTTIHLHREREMAELLGVPFESYTQVGLFPVAYTIGTEFRPGRRRAVEDVTYWNHWGSTA